MFTGREYQTEFDEACETLSDSRKSKHEVRSTLLGLEWVVWEAIRGALITGCAVFSIIISLAFHYALDINPRSSWTVGILSVSSTAVLGVAQYAVLRLALYSELIRHVRNHKFGKLDIVS